MSDSVFVPFYPPRPVRRLSAPALLWTARRNLLAIWDERCSGCHGLAGTGGDKGPDFKGWGSRA